MADDDVLSIVLQADGTPFRTAMASSAEDVENFTNAATSGFRLSAEGAENAAESMSHLGKATRVATTEFYNTEMSIRVLNNALGLQMGRHIEYILASMPKMQAVFANAFSVTLVAVFAEALLKVVEHLIKMEDAASKAGELSHIAISRIVGDLVDQGDQLNVVNDKLDDQIAKLNHKPANWIKDAFDEAIVTEDKLAKATGAFVAEFNKELKDSANNIGFWQETLHNSIEVALQLVTFGQANFHWITQTGDQTKLIKGFMDQLTDAQIKYNNAMADAGDDTLKKAAAGITLNSTNLGIYKNAIDGATDAWKILKKQEGPGIDLGANETMLSDFARSMKAAQADTNKTIAEQGKEGAVTQLEATKDAQARMLALAQAKLESDKKIGTDGVNAWIAGEKEKLTAGTISLGTYTAELLDAEKARTAIEDEYVKGSIALVVQKGRDGLVEKEHLITEGLAADIAGQAKTDAITAEAAAHERAINLKNAEQQITQDEKTGIARVAIAQATSKALASVKGITPQDEAAQQEGYEREITGIRLIALMQRRQLDETDSNIRLSNQKAIDAEIVQTVQASTAKIIEIVSTGDAKTLQQKLADMRTTTSMAVENTNAQLKAYTDADDTRLKHGEESQSQWLKNEQNVLNTWYLLQKSAYAQSEAAVDALVGKESTQYKALIKQEEGLDLEYALKNQQLHEKTYQDYIQMAQKEQQVANTNITQAIMGQETWSKALKNIYSSLLETIIQYYLKKEEQALLNWIKEDVLGKASSDANALTQIQAAASVAAANAFASTAAIPLVGLSLAPAAAAAAYAQVMATAALTMEEGGIVPRTGMIMAHESEGVLPANLTSMLMGAANAGGSKLGSTLPAGGHQITFNGGIHVNSKSSSTGGDVAKDIKQKLRRMNLQPA